MKGEYRVKNGVTIVLSAWLGLSGFSAVAEAGSHRTATRTATVQSTAEPARLIIRRLPTLGNNVIVDLYVDGAPFASATYGHTIDATLTPGRHVLSVQASPGPSYITRTNTTLDVRSGETYIFTAEGNQSGNLILN